MPTPVSAWTELVKSLSDTYRKWLDTRDAAYERSRDKKQERAIAEAEEAFKLMDELFTFIYEKVQLNPLQQKLYIRLKTKILLKKTQFNKYD